MLSVILLAFRIGFVALLVASLSLTHNIIISAQRSVHVHVHVSGANINHKLVLNTHYKAPKADKICCGLLLTKQSLLKIEIVFSIHVTKNRKVQIRQKVSNLSPTVPFDNRKHCASIVTKIQCKKPLIRANLILSDPELEETFF